jgi:hypothetical protein
MMPKRNSAKSNPISRLSSENGYFTDSKNNVIMLRGVNLSGSSKIPMVPDGTTAFDQTMNLQNHRNVSFVGRPFPEEDANEHFDRLKKWGINFIRFLITWEAIEHEGQGKYDESYIDYVARIISKAEKKGIYVFIDPHQDVWSRMTGGDGAPGWTLESIGIDVKKLIQSDSVNLHHAKGKQYRRMSWPLNYNKYPTATMFSLFFAGNLFAPKISIDDKSIQDYLQDSYINSICMLAKKISKFKNVVGFDSLNEPSSGWIGKKNLSEYKGFGIDIVEGATPFQEMCISEGIPVNVMRYYMLGFVKVPFGNSKLNTKALSIWAKDEKCIWRKHGVWNYDPNGAPMLLKPDYFLKVNGKEIDFYTDCMKPFVKKFKTSLQKVQKQFFIFMESDPVKLELEWNEKEKKGYAGVVNATHWYDGTLLFTKKYIDLFGVHSFKQKAVFGVKAIEEMYLESILMIKKMSEEKMNNCPTVIGETGVPMDMENKIAFLKNDYRLIEKSLDRIYTAVEKNLVNITLWNYTPDNTHEFGDRWNEEDLSIYSIDTDESYDSDRGRGVIAFSRPFPISTTGIPVSLSFDMLRGLLKYSFKQKGDSIGACILFLPPIHYERGFTVTVNAGTYKFDEKSNFFYFTGEKGTELYGVTISPV